jgi:hypothetical protein
VELLGPPFCLGGITDEQVVLEAGDVRHDGSRAFTISRAWNYILIRCLFQVFY